MGNTMFFFFNGKEEFKSFVGHLSCQKNGIYFIQTQLSSFNPMLKCTLIDPYVYWVADFNTIYEQLLFRIGTKLLKTILRTFQKLKHKYDEVPLIHLLLNLHKAEDIEYTEKEVIKHSKSFFRILISSEKNIAEGLYKLLRGSQKKKVVFLSLLFSLLYKTKRSKIIILLRNLESALCAVTPYVRTSIVIKFLSFLELSRCPILIIIPCNVEIFKEYRQMYEWITRGMVDFNCRRKKGKK